MTHLPKRIKLIVQPFIEYIANDPMNKTGYSMSVFDVLNENYQMETDETLLFDIHKYHWWFVSFDEFDADSYIFIKNEIDIFNKSNDTVNLHLSYETGGNERRICHSDSDNYGTFYFIISATDKDNKHFSYTLPNKIMKIIKTYDKIDFVTTSMYKKHANSTKRIKVSPYVKSVGRNELDDIIKEMLNMKPSRSIKFKKIWNDIQKMYNDSKNTIC